MLFTAGSWKRLLAAIPDGAVRRYVLSDKPRPDTALAEAPLLAVDVETTGLNPRNDQLLSIGFVPVDGDVIELAGAGRVLVRPTGAVGDSAVIHGLTDDALAAALPLPEALEVVFAALQGRLLLAHHARIETGFLGMACQRLFGARPRFGVVDTLRLQHRLLSHGFDDEPPPGSLRLWGARSQYGLPRYGAHDALTDALACAELYLAQVAELQALSSRSLTVKAVLSY